jgi:hypothetical protein
MNDRTFEAIDRNGNSVEFELKVPGLSEENEGERQYRIAYSKALVEGIFPKQKIKEVMREHNMWTDEDEKELSKTVGMIAVHQIALSEAEKKGDEKACIEEAGIIHKHRKRLWELFLVQQSVYMNSAEGIAELIKMESTMAACTLVKATGERYWKNYKEYIEERDFNQRATVYQEVVELQTSLLEKARDEINSEYIESKYIKDFNERMIDREVEQEVVKLLKKRSEEEAKEPAPKKPRRKRTTKIAKKDD